jgi:hypothetical protein
MANILSFVFYCFVRRRNLSFFTVLCFLFFASCKQKNTPDVSHITINIETARFENDFFSIDTNRISQQLTMLQKKYGTFLNDYLYNILAIPPYEDSLIANIKLFISTYKPVYDTVKKQFPSFATQQKEIKKALQFLKYYFPEYSLPTHIITFVGPLEGYGNVLTNEGFAVGLQLYLGATNSLYESEYFQQIYPYYKRRRFEPAYIPINCMQNVITDLYPEQKVNTLIEQMIEQGKRMYILDFVLPETPDTLKTGYTQQQLKYCKQYEAAIWNFFIQNNLLYETDPFLLRDYITDGPKTLALGEDAPGNIGLYIGWQIVKKWMSIQKNPTLQMLIQTPAKTIFEEAKYKPR